MPFAEGIKQYLEGYAPFKSGPGDLMSEGWHALVCVNAIEKSTQIGKGFNWQFLLLDPKENTTISSTHLMHDPNDMERVKRRWFSLQRLAHGLGLTRNDVKDVTECEAFLLRSGIFLITHTEVTREGAPTRTYANISEAISVNLDTIGKDEGALNELIAAFEWGESKSDTPLDKAGLLEALGEIEKMLEADDFDLSEFKRSAVTVPTDFELDVGDLGSV